jgi:predicted RNase H-like HicB family nuclease
MPYLIMNKRTYSIVLEPEQGGGYAVSVPALPGCFTQGATIEEAIERAAEAISVHIAGLQVDGESIPEEHEQPRIATVTVAA